MLAVAVCYRWIVCCLLTRKRYVGGEVRRLPHTTLNGNVLPSRHYAVAELLSTYTLVGQDARHGTNLLWGSCF